MTRPEHVLSLLAASLLLGCLDERADRDAAWHDAWVPAEGDDPQDGQARDATAHTFYIRSSGDDAASGVDPAHAWRTLERVNAQDLEPGDHVLFEAGATFVGTLRLDANDSGTTRSPVRVSSYGDGRARIEAGSGDGVVIDNVSGLIVERLSVVGGFRADEQSGNDGEGVSAIASESGRRQAFLRLQDLEIQGFRNAGIGLHARPSDDSKESGYEDVSIQDCTVFDNGDFGVLSDGPYIYDGPGYSHASVTIRRVVSHHNRGLRNKGAHTGSGIVLSDVAGGLIEHSIAHHNGEYNDHPGGGGFGIWAWDSDRITIQHNESYANESSTADGGGFDLDGGITRSVMQFNYSHDNRGAGYGAFQFAWARPYSDNRIQYNISQNDGFGFLVWDGNGDMGSLDVLHNVSYGATPALVTYSRLADVSLVNNVFWGVGTVLLDVHSGAALTLQGNDYWTGDRPLQIRWDRGTPGAVDFSSFEEFRAATGLETLDGAASGFNVDPALRAAGAAPTLDDTDRLTSLREYELGDASPLIDRGVDPLRFGIEPPSRDYFGGATPLGMAADIGAHELR
jgi:hypothetical protein